MEAPLAAAAGALVREGSAWSERWVATPDGLAVSWQLLVRPLGGGSLIVRWRIDDGEVEVAPGRIIVRSDVGRWGIGHLAAWDAHGRPLDAHFEEAGDGLVDITVDDRGAVWPVFIDPLVETETYQLKGAAIGNPAFQDEFATEGIVGGDLNGDGIGDLAMSWNAGARTSVFYGTRRGPPERPNRTQGPVFAFEQPRAIAALDWDGDGIDDVATGDTNNSQAGDAGFVRIDLSDGGTVSCCLNATDSNQMGSDLIVLGDINGDGRDDLAARSVGSPYVFLTARAVQTFARNRWSVDYVWPTGDVNGDGTDDVTVTDHGPGGDTMTTYAGPVTSDPTRGGGGAVLWTWSGSGAAIGADVNDDGYSDIVVSVAGRLFDVYFGGTTGASPVPDNQIPDPPGLPNAVVHDIITGEFDGDGYADIAIRSNTRILVYRGGPGGLAASPAFEVRADSGPFYPASALIAASDVTADGVDDLAYLYGDRTYDALVYVHTGFVDLDDDGVHAEEDCDDQDAGVGPPGSWWPDSDADGHGAVGAPLVSCETPPGHVTTHDDCDDLANAVYPGATEVDGDGVDGDCDGRERCAVDADGDGHRAPGAWQAANDGDCMDPGEAVVGLPDDDCDDRDASVHPGAPDLPADGVDEDCDGVELCALDADGDGHALAGSTVLSLDGDCADAGEALGSAAADDCDDAVRDIHPGVTELLADGVDQDCDGFEACPPDADGDGHAGAGAPAVSADLDCADPGEGTGPGDDCDDSEASVHPGAEEVVADHVDQNCDAVDQCWVDADGDGYRDDVATTPDTGLDCLGRGLADSSMPTGDCDDDDGSVHPTADEVTADGIDQDCDGVDMCWTDVDGDGYRGDSNTVTGAGLGCDLGEEAGASTPAGDCDDAAASTHPDATEVPGNPVDEDCDGVVMCLADADGDGVTGGEFVASGDGTCDGEGELAAGAPAGDCADLDAGVGPDVAEVCGDGVDQDCAAGDLACASTEEPPAGCACDAAGRSGGLGGLLLTALVLRRRRAA